MREKSNFVKKISCISMMKIRKLTMSEMGRLSVDAYKHAPKLPVVVVLDNVRSHHNVGAIFRTCDCFACEAVYLCGITGTPPHRDIQKTALGATETVEWQYFDNTTTAIYELKNQNYNIVALEIAAGSASIDDFNVNNNSKIALVVGNEVNGIDQNIIDLCDTCIEIPQYGTKHSLNVSVSGGIALWHICKQMRKNNS